MKSILINRWRVAVSLAVFVKVVVLAAMVVFGADAKAEDSQPGESAAAKANHCIGCHHIPGLRSVFPVVYPVPKIIGQSEDYLIAALQAYKSGLREHPSMTGIAAQLSDEDIAELAKFYAQGAKE